MVRGCGYFCCQEIWLLIIGCTSVNIYVYTCTGTSHLIFHVRINMYMYMAQSQSSALRSTCTIMMYVHHNMYVCTWVLKPSSAREKLCYTLLMWAKKPKTAVQGLHIFLVALRTWFFMYVHTCRCTCIYVHVSYNRLFMQLRNLCILAQKRQFADFFYIKCGYPTIDINYVNYIRTYVWFQHNRINIMLA